MGRVVKSARWTEELNLAVGEHEVADPSAGEVQVSVDSVGICGSDLHFWRSNNNDKETQ